MTPEQKTSSLEQCSRGLVIRTAGRTAEVEVNRRTMCENCPDHGACFYPGDGGGRILARVRNPLGARAGDEVELAISAQALLGGAFVVYIIPILFLLASTIGAYYLAPALGYGKADTLFVLLAGGLGLALSLAVVRMLSKRWRSLDEGGPVITRIISHG